MTSDTTFDVLVLGAGPAGENAADVAARDGLRVAIVERELVGGECSYWGCMPSKALLRPGEVLEEIARVPGARGLVTGVIDLDDALRRRDAFTSNWDDAGQVAWLDSVGVDLIRGQARLAGERTVDVTGSDGTTTRYAATRAVVVATGTSSALPPIPGLADISTWDNRDITTAKQAPRRLLVIGGGAIGVEMAQAWRWLGSEEVTLVELSDHLLPREEPFAGAELAVSLAKMGITVHVSATTERIERDGTDGPVHATVKLADGSTAAIEADEVLVATGRRPNTDDIGLDTVGLEPGRSIVVDDHLLATDVDGGWLYAVGDVNGRSLLTHTGKYQARIAGAHINGVDTSAWGDTKATPRVLFTSPEVAAVGLTERQARERGIEVRTVRYDIGRVAAASVLGKGHKGTVQLVVDADRRVIVGATFVGPRAGELLHAATIAIVGEVTLDTLWHAVPSFPTLGEVWLRLLEAYRDEYQVPFR
jgi:dihydrolipoamide dehydrogenase